MYLTPGGQILKDLVAGLIDGYYPDLAECQVTYATLLAHPNPEKPDKPPLVVGGHPVAGFPKITPYQYRVLKVPDVRLYFDANRWENSDDKVQAAIIDGQLQRLVVRRDKKEGHIVTDECGRPLLSLRPHDYQLSVSDVIIRRHGRSALEAQAMEELSLHYNTLLPIDSGS